MLANLPQASRDLLAAADYIREHGWCQYEWVDAHGRVCIMSAISKVSDNFNISHKALCQHLGVSQHRCEAVDWNNAPGRTIDEVLSALESAAKRSASNTRTTEQ